MHVQHMVTQAEHAKNTVAYDAAPCQTVCEWVQARAVRGVGVRLHG
jgi:hypothetical protein